MPIDKPPKEKKIKFEFLLFLLENINHVSMMVEDFHQQTFFDEHWMVLLHVHQ
jgi:hypothetical protein